MEQMALFFYLFGCLCSLVLSIPGVVEFNKNNTSKFKRIGRCLLAVVDVALSWYNVFILAASKVYGLN